MKINKPHTPEQQVFEHLFNLYFGKVSYFIFSIVKCEDAARDIAQEIFLRLWEDRHIVTLNESMGRYIYTIARNKSLDYLKHKKHKDNFREYSLHTASDVYSQEDHHSAKETYSLIDDAVSKMPEQRKEIFILSRYKGLSNSQIAEKFNIKKQHVDYQIMMALKELRKVVKNQ